MEQKNIEQRVANTILQKPIDVEVGGRTFRVPQPTVATLIMVSEEIGRTPNIALDSKNPILESIAKARYYKNIGRIFATIVLGAKRIKEDAEEARAGRRFFGRKKRGSLFEFIAEHIIEDYTPKALNELLGKLLEDMQIGFFFAITTSLNDINNLKPTTSPTTVSGQ